MCNNNRPKLTPEQKMVNSIFHSVLGEEVYKLDLDPDTEGEYMMDICRYLRCMTDDLNPEDPESMGEGLNYIGYILEVLKAVLSGKITEEQLKDIEEWQQYLEAR